jgi:hypothetical protein
MKAFRFCIYFLPLFISSAVLAQSGGITGHVSSSAGAPVVSVTVTLENATSGARQTATTDSSGQYRFDNLGAGTYRLTAGNSQFTGTPSQDIIVAATPKTIDIVIQANTAQAITSSSSLNIVDTTPALDTTGMQIQNSFNTRYIQFLPQPNFIDRRGRAFGAYNLSLLSPQVTSNGGIGEVPGPVVGGQRPQSNNYNIEGIDNNNRILAGPNLYLSNDATTEFVLFQNQFPPEYGHSTGGQFNSYVRTGTSRIHGSAYEYSQNRNFNAMDASFSRQGFTDQPRYDQNRVGGNVGLPLWKNNLFFFGDFEFIPLRTRSIGAGPVFAPTAAGYSQLAALPGVSRTNLSVLQSNLGAATSPTGFTTINGVQIPVGYAQLNAPISQDQYIGTGSLDWNIRNSDQLRARYVHNDLDANNNGQILPSFFTPTRGRDMVASVSEYHNFTSLVVNELRLGYNRFSRSSTPVNNAFPGLTTLPNIEIQNLNVVLGTGLNTPRAAQNTYQISDNVNWIFNSHTIRFGIDWRRFIGPLSFAQFGNGSYTYSDVARFLLDFSPDVSSQRVFGNQSFSGNQWATYAYINDSWQLTPTINVNLGLRYQFSSVPNGLKLQALNSIADVPGLLSFREPESQKTNFAPRVGIAWSPGMLRGSVFRAGFGMNYDALFGTVGVPSVPPGITTTVIGETVTYLPGFLFGGALIQPAAFNVFTPTVTPQQARALTTSYVPDQRLPYTIQWNASLQQQIFNRFVVEARYLGVRGVHMPVQTVLNRGEQPTATRNLPLFNTPPSQATLNSLTTTLNSLQGTQANPYTAAGFTSPIRSVIPGGNSWYHGLGLQATQRFSRGLQALLNYTWSHLIDDMSGPPLSPQGSFTFAEQRIGRHDSVFDHRHRATATVLWDVGGIGTSSFSVVRDILANFTIAGTYTYESPAHLFVQSGLDAGFGDGIASGVFVNPNGVPGTGSGVTPLQNSNGQVVAYLANNPNAQFVRAAAGTFPTGGLPTITGDAINNFDVSASKRFAIRERFSIEFRGDAYNLVNHSQFTPAEITSIGSSRAFTRNFVIPGSPAFNNPGTAFSNHARTIQLGFRAQF